MECLTGRWVEVDPLCLVVSAPRLLSDPVAQQMIGIASRAA